MVQVVAERTAAAPVKIRRRVPLAAQAVITGAALGVELVAFQDRQMAELVRQAVVAAAVLPVRQLMSAVQIQPKQYGRQRSAVRLVQGRVQAVTGRAAPLLA